MKYDAGMKMGELLAGIANELHYKNCLKVLELKGKGMSDTVINTLLQKHNF